MNCAHICILPAERSKSIWFVVAGAAGLPEGTGQDSYVTVGGDQPLEAAVPVTLGACVPAAPLHGRAKAGTFVLPCSAFLCYVQGDHGQMHCR